MTCTPITSWLMTQFLLKLCHVVTNSARNPTELPGHGKIPTAGQPNENWRSDPRRAAQLTH